MNCIYSDSPRFLNNLNKSRCSYKRKYGDYCYKHRRYHLLDTENIINKNTFTYLLKDYNIIDLVNTLNHIYPKKKWNKIKKKKLFDEYVIHVNNYKKNNIIKIQSYIRRYLVRLNLYRGPGYFMNTLCKNDEDFYYMSKIHEIYKHYLFTYKDDLNNIWGFDIRSFKRLIIDNSLNPYTRQAINTNVINNANKLINKLSKSNIDTNLETDIIDRKYVSKQKTVDICSTLSEFGYYCDINWFLTLDIVKLKGLYRSLEDIWNYRAYLSNEVKSRISPPNGLVFNISVRDIFNYTNIDDLRETILNEILKFNNAINIEDKKLGYMYFLIGLSEINPNCLDSHEWIQYVL